MSISAIMTGLQGLAPTYDTDVTVNIRAYSGMKDVLNESECPVRMIGVLDDKQGAEYEVRNMNNKDLALWSILDRAYLFPVPLDQGIKNFNHKILDYMDSYMTAVSGDKCIGLSSDGVKVQNVSFSSPYVRRYPDVEGSPAFWVVDALVTIQEYR